MRKSLPAVLAVLLFLIPQFTPFSGTTLAQESRKGSDPPNKQSARPGHAGKTEIHTMLKSEIIDRVRWDDYGLGKLSLYVPLVKKDLPFVLFPESDKAHEVTDKMTATINDVLALQPENLNQVKELLWEECTFAFQVADYGVEVKEGETPMQAHLREFGLKTPDDAYNQSEMREIHISDEFEGRYAELKIETASQNYVSIIIKNGRIIDFDDDGTHLGWFDSDEQYAHKKRQKVIGK